MKQLLGLIFGTALLLAPAVVGAATAQTIGITPTAVTKVIQPGSTASGTIEVLNQGPANFGYSIYASPYAVVGEDYDPEFALTPGATDTASWFHFSSSAGQLPSGNGATINYTIQVPADTAPGGYYGAIFAQTAPSLVPDAIGPTTIKRVGTVFYLQVGNGGTLNGRVASWSVPMLQTAPLTGTLRLQNEGSDHYLANMRITVSDVFGDPRYRFEQEREVLPQTIRRVVIPWSGTPALGLFKVTGSVGIFGVTTTLPTKFVLVANGPARLVISAVLVVVVLLVAWNLFRRRKP
jgi:hypothetical protein